MESIEKQIILQSVHKIEPWNQTLFENLVFLLFLFVQRCFGLFGFVFLVFICFLNDVLVCFVILLVVLIIFSCLVTVLVFSMVLWFVVYPTSPSPNCRIVVILCRIASRQSWNVLTFIGMPVPAFPQKFEHVTRSEERAQH